MTTLRQNLILGLLLCCFCCNFRPTHPFVFQRIECPQHHRFYQRSASSVLSRTILHGRSDPEDQTKQPKNEDEDDDPVEEFLAMEEASKRVYNRLMMPRRIFSSIGSTIQFMGYGFLIFCFALNIAGYALINDGGSYHIGTLEERNFQMEIAKSIREK